MFTDIYMVATRNFLDTVSEADDVKIRETAIRRLGDKGKNQWGETIPDMIVFDPKYSGEKYEDNNRTLRVGMNLPGKVYAKLDDYGSPEVLAEQVGHMVRTRFVLTLMMAEDY